MASDVGNGEKPLRKYPLYQTVDGFRIPAVFSAESFRSGLAYKPRPGDLFIVTYPRCGTTWVQNIVACIYRGGKPFQSFAEFLTHSPFLQLAGAESAENMRRPGAIKVHLPFRCTPWSPEAKYIFIARNPKDCCVSFYHLTENITSYCFEGGSFDVFFDLFVEGETDFGDYFDVVMSWYEHKNDPNVLFLTFEELQKDTVGNVLKIAEFLGSQYKEALERDEKFFHDVMKHSSFEYMKEHLNRDVAELQNVPKDEIKDDPDLPSGVRDLFSQDKDVFKKKSSNVTFVRKGMTGDWKNYFSQEQNAKLEMKFKKIMGNTELAEIWKDVM